MEGTDTLEDFSELRSLAPSCLRESELDQQSESCRAGLNP